MKRIAFVGSPDTIVLTQAMQVADHFSLFYLDASRASDHEDEANVSSVVEKLTTIGGDQGFVIAGFPKTLRQAVLFEARLWDLRICLDAVVEIAGVESEPDIAAQQMANYYWNNGLLISIPASQTEQERLVAEALVHWFDTAG